MYVHGDGGGGGGFRQATNAPRAIFKSHFTLLRVKRPDTALCEGRGKKGRRGREREGENERSSERWEGNDGEDSAESGGGKQRDVTRERRRLMLERRYLQYGKGSRKRKRGSQAVENEYPSASSKTGRRG